MIKQPWFMAISCLCLVALAYFAVERLSFLAGAERTTGQVVRITSENGRCGGKHKHSCTKYQAIIDFTADGSHHTMNISGGNSRGHNQPKSEARFQVGDDVNIVYDPEKPEKSYEDTLFGVWGTPIMLLIAQIVTLFSSFSEPRRRW